MRLLIGVILLFASVARADFVLSGAAERSLEQLFDIPSGQIVVLDMKCKALPALSKVGRSKIVCDSATNTLKASVNGGAFSAFGSGSAAGGANAVQSNSGGNFADSGCTAVGGVLTCVSYTSPDANNAATNYLALTGNGASTATGVDCATIGVAKKLTLANTNKTDTDSQRAWQYCQGATPTAYAFPSPAGIDLFDDFVSDNGNSNGTDKPQGPFGWGWACSTGTAAVSGTNSPDSVTLGVATWGTAATNGQICDWFVPAVSGTKPWRNFPSDTTWFYQARLSLKVQANIAWAWGLADITTAVDPTAIQNGLIIQFIPATDATHYLCTTCNAGNCASPTQMGTVSSPGTFDKLKISMSGALLQCCVNDVCVTNNAHMPASTTNLTHMMALKDISAAMTVDNDYQWLHTPTVAR